MCGRRDIQRSSWISESHHQTIASTKSDFSSVRQYSIKISPFSLQSCHGYLRLVRNKGTVYSPVTRQYLFSKIKQPPQISPWGKNCGLSFVNSTSELVSYSFLRFMRYRSILKPVLTVADGNAQLSDVICWIVVSTVIRHLRLLSLFSTGRCRWHTLVCRGLLHGIALVPCVAKTSPPMMSRDKQASDFHKEWFQLPTPL